MDVVYKAGSLLATQAGCLLAVFGALPGCLWRAAWPVRRRIDEEDGSCVFYEGVVTHCRKRPVANAFE